MTGVRVRVLTAEIRILQLRAVQGPRHVDVLCADASDMLAVQDLLSVRVWGVCPSGRPRETRHHTSAPEAPATVVVRIWALGSGA